MNLLSRFSHLAKQIRIENKLFSLEFDESYAGSVITLLERNSHGVFQLNVGLEGAYWIGNNVLEAVQNVNDRKFFRIRRFNTHQIWVNRLENNNGTFLKVSSVGDKLRLKCIIISMGVNAAGWSHFAQLILSIFSSGGKIDREGESKSNRTRSMKNDDTANKNGEADSEIRKRERGKSEASFAECLVFGQWTRAVVCSKMEGWIEWSCIQRVISKFLGFMVDLKSFYDDKAVFFCHDAREAHRIGKLGKCLLDGSVYVLVQKWSPEVNSDKEKVAFGGGWIAIEGLPFHLWNWHSFSKIAEFCGGLIQIDKRTKNFQVLREAMIKVGKKGSGFIPAVIEIKDGEGKIDIRIRPSTKFSPYGRSSPKLMQRTKVEEDVRGNGERFRNSNFPNKKTPSKQIRGTWRVRWDNRGCDTKAVKSTGPDAIREENGFLRNLKQKQGDN